MTSTLKLIRLIRLNHAIRLIHSVRLMPLFAASLAMLLSPLSQAANRPPVTYSLSNNDTVQVTLSSVDLNRLTVTDDSIASVHCPTGFCVIDKQNDSSGGVLLSIKAAAQSGPSGTLIYPPFTLFIDTQNGRHFGVLAIPLAQPAQTAIFNVKENQLEKMVKQQKNTLYLSNLTTLMKSAILASEQHRDVNGYIRSVMQVNKTTCHQGRVNNHNNTSSHASNTLSSKACERKQQRLFEQGKNQRINALPRIVYHNGINNIIVYSLYNNTDSAAPLHPEQYYVDGLQALVIEPAIDTLFSNQRITMVQIVTGTGSAATGGYDE